MPFVPDRVTRLHFRPDTSPPRRDAQVSPQVAGRNDAFQVLPSGTSYTVHMPDLPQVSPGATPRFHPTIAPAPHFRSNKVTSPPVLPENDSFSVISGISSSTLRVPGAILAPPADVMGSVGRLYHVMSVPAEMSIDGWRQIFDLSHDAMRDYVARSTPGNVTAMVIDQMTKDHESFALNMVTGASRAALELFTETSAGMITPEALVLGVAGKGLSVMRPELTALAKRAVATLPEEVKRLTIYRYNQPELYKALAEQTQVDLALRREVAANAARPIIKLSKADQQIASQFMRGKLPATQTPLHVQAAVKNAADLFVEWGKEAVETGRMSPETFEFYKGRYLPQLYRSFEEGKGVARGLATKPTRLDLERFKTKHDEFGLRWQNGQFAKSQVKKFPLKEFGTMEKAEAARDAFAATLPEKAKILERFAPISDEAKLALGSIEEAGYPTAKGLAQLGHDVEMTRFFKKTASNLEWVVGKGSPQSGDAALRGFVEMPSEKKFGDLAGKLVHPAIADDINEITRIRPAWQRVYDSLISKWKFGKVVLNPGAHFRNTFSNTLLLDLSGVELHEQPRLMLSAVDQIRTKGIFYQEARAKGLLAADFVSGELRAAKKQALNGTGSWLDRIGAFAEDTTGIRHLKHGADAIAEGAAKVYQTEENLFKLAKYIKERELGNTIEGAIQHAEKWEFNYGKVSKLIEMVRRSPVGSPFITYTAKALPRVAETAIYNPLRLYKYHVLFNVIEEHAKDALGLSDADIETIHRTSRGSVLVLPMRDRYKNPLVLDLSYILPWGDIGEQGGPYIGGLMQLPPVSPPNGPLKAVAETMVNHSMYTDKEIWQGSDPPGVRLRKVSDYLLKAFLPSLTPGDFREGEAFFKGGYSFQKIADSIGPPLNPMGPRPDYFGRLRDPFLVAMDTILGVKIFPVDLLQKKRFEITTAKRLTQEARLSLRKVLNNKGASLSYKAAKVDRYIETSEKIWKDVKEHQAGGTPRFRRYDKLSGDNP